jgi:hypothetical protein
MWYAGISGTANLTICEDCIHLIDLLTENYIYTLRDVSGTSSLIQERP